MRRLALVLFSFNLGPPCTAQAPVTAVRATRPPVIDGVIEEAEWAGAARFENFIQFEPQRGKPATQPTVAYLLYDDTHVYFGVRAYDDRPDQITARLTQRDAVSSQDDSITIFLDTFHDRRTCYFFSANPLGTQADGRVQDNGRVNETAWDAAWNVVARKTSDGWVAEFAIPLRAMLFRSGKDRVWGLSIVRTRRSNLETTFWAPAPLESIYRVSQYGELTGLELERGAHPYQFIPYTLGRYEQGRSLKGNLGFDFRYAFRPETTANLTINPDFATIEADEEFVNLTRFEAQLTEKRPFFLETNNRFRQRIQPFYSRRIADIDIGGNLLSRKGPWDFTLLSARSGLPELSSTGSRRFANYTVARVDRQILKSSTLGMMVSNRSLDGENRGAVGLDTTMFFTRRFGFTGQLIRSHGPFKTGRWAYFIRPAYDSSTGHFHLRYTHLGDRFGDNLNATGFIPDDDRREFDSDIEKTLWFKTGTVQRIMLSSKNNIYWSQRKVLRSYHNIESIQVEFRNRWNLLAQHKNDFKLFEKGFHNDTAQFQIGYNTREFQSWALGYEDGRNFDSDLKALSGHFRRKLTPQLAAEYQFSRVWLKPDPKQTATLINIFRVRHNFTRDLFLRLFFQTNSVIDRKNLEAVFVWRYKPPFGSIQFAFQRGRAAWGERSQQGNTYFLKLAHVF
jgi:hypothetical protein